VYCRYHQGNELTAFMVETVSISETSINFYKATGRNNKNGCLLNNRRRENLKSHSMFVFVGT
jgi:hypothetical protein